MKIIQGDIFETGQSGKVEVLEYNNCNNIIVKFINNPSVTAKVTASNLRAGRIRDPYLKTVWGVGYIGVGPYKFSKKVNGKSKFTKEYSAWEHMLRRCYAQDKGYGVGYEGCYVREDWHNFQNFAEWCSKQKYEESWHLDKDILKMNNKVYSEDTCAFVPRYLNFSLSTKGSRKLTDFLTGTRFSNGEYVARICFEYDEKIIGRFETEMQAHKAWQNAKVQVLYKYFDRYTKERFFNSLVADMYLDRIWKLKLDMSTDTPTVTL